MKKLFAILLIAFTMLLTGCGSTANEKFLEDNKNVQSIPYRDVHSSLSIDRVNVIAIVDSKVAKEDLDNIAKKVVATAIKANSKVHGVYVHFTDTDIKGIPYTLGEYEYGPDGSAGYNDKKLDAPKKLVDKNLRINRDWSKKPTEDEYKHYVLYMDYLRKNSEGTEADFLNQFSGAKPTVEQLKNSVNKVELWMLGGK